MIHGIPETYHEASAMFKSICLNRYIKDVDEKLVRDVYTFLLQHWENRIYITQNKMEWYDSQGMCVCVMPVTLVNHQIDSVEITLERVKIQHKD